VSVIRYVIFSLAALSLGPAYPRFVVEETTIGQVHAAFQNHTLTCRALVDTYLARIARYDHQGPELNAIASINPLAQTEAARLDKAFAERGLTGPLHCVPVIVKDNIQTAGWETTAGSLALKGFIPDRDATAITRLKAAGAIILAKSNMSDLALNALATVNLIQGATRNPYALNRVPAGSSGGTAVAVAANFGLVGLGTDTGNSVRGPAAHASLVGIRPTLGLTSRAGLIPLDMQSDAIGPMARTVEDAAMVLDVLVGHDPADPTTEVLRQWPTKPSMLAAAGNGLDGIRIGVLRQAYQGGNLRLDPQIARVFANALNDLESLGAEVVDSVSIEFVPNVPGAEACHGLKYDLNAYLAAQGARAPVSSLAAIIASGRFHASVADDMRALNAINSEGPGSQACRLASDYREAVAGALSDEMLRLHLDVLVYPTWSQLPQMTSKIVLEEAGQSLRFATASGFPAMTVPMGFTPDALPVGLSFLSRSWSEISLIRVGYAYEQATRHRRPPVLAPPIPCLCGDIR